MSGQEYHDPGGIMPLSARVRRISSLLRAAGLYLVMLALSSGGLLILASGLLFSSSSRSLLIQFAVVLSLMGIGLAAFWDQLARRGSIYASALTDAVQDPSVYSQEGDPREWRFRIREYEQSAELPLVPGRYGVTVYVLVFVGQIVVALIVSHPV